MKLSNLLKISALGMAAVLTATPASAILLSGWTGTGNSGTLGADGVVTLSPYGDSQYGYVSTNGGVTGVGLPGVGGTGNATDGSVITSPIFAAESGDALEFYFNYVTSDGAGYADYAWARLLDAASNEVALLFTARTRSDGGDTVPGFSMPAPTATLTPGSTPIIGGAPTWSPLGSESGSCYDTGCGYTGWIQAAYNIGSAGNYRLEIGVVNWNDSAFDSGMAFDGATIAGTVIGEPTDIPTPAPLALLGLGLMSLWLSRRHTR
ncbi:NF038132 family protein [Lacimicrobium sp. SS2-24]|uniref:NF038132 family protein n=1 Tax=Lacimicrobium sp. SS2-24 TaxID=2005569 RepID=UPI000B4BD8C9|nr:NF038132 family protein [Lacimicrobium sp. SS2-24]